MTTNPQGRFTRPQVRPVLCLLFFVAAGIAALGAIGSSRAISTQGGAIVPDARPTPTPCTGTATFSNTAPIAIPDFGIATPYPSDITVDLPMWVTAGSAEVTINGLTHAFADDVGIVLVGPGGAALLIQDSAGDGTVANVTYTLSDTGAAQLPATGTWGAGTYKPTSYYTDHSFPPPGPATAYGNPGPAGGNSATFASIFGGTNATGVWSLYAVDFAPGNSGMIAGGWSLSFTLPIPCEPPPPRSRPTPRPRPSPPR
jgi:subtilisin-like proprotein convertase family protein